MPGSGFALSTLNRTFAQGVGGAREDRTPDLLRARQALSQLSYGPVGNRFSNVSRIAPGLGGSGWS